MDEQSAQAARWRLEAILRAAGYDLVIEMPRDRPDDEAAGQAWDTSVFPDARSGSFSLPVKKAVRVAAGIGEGDELTVTLSLLDAP